MFKPTTRLSESLPPLIFGTATFNYQFNPDPFALGPDAIVQHALAHGIRAFDTSPYYGPSEDILGTALSTHFVRQHYPREQYVILTKAGRVSADSFDYSPAWIRHSVKRSCKRLRTQYLDLVYCHDVEFVSPDEVLGAVRELRHLRDETGMLKYVGISGYPVTVLCDLAEMILQETGEPLDAVMSYANFTLQNTRLLSEGLPRLLAAGVDVIPNASPLGMGLLRRQGPPIGAMGNWHPAPDELRQAIAAASEWIDSQGEKLEVVAFRFALETWMREGAKAGALGGSLTPTGEAYQSQSKSVGKLGVTVMGVSKIEELDETMRVWRSVVDGLVDDLDQDHGSITPRDAVSDHEWSLQRRQRIRVLAKSIRGVIGQWADFAWASPDPKFVNKPNSSDWNDEEIFSEMRQGSAIPSALVTPPSEPVDSGSTVEIPGVQF